MSVAVTEAKDDVAQSADRPVVNDVVIHVATKNGSGSQSSNLILMRSIFNMGIPVSGKNLFPSNIQGLPTWFTIRANEEGWVARRRDTDLVVCMNAETAEEDVAEMRPGAILVIDEALKRFVTRDDILVYEVPFLKLVKEACSIGRLRKLVVNVIYVGVVAYLLDIDMVQVKAAVYKQFASKQKAADLNWGAAEAGYKWAEENLGDRKQKDFTFKPSTAAKGKIVIEGNQASALGMMFGGATVAAWYPITPSSSLCEALIAQAEKYRTDPETGKTNCAIIQAEDELASIAIVVGAGWAGARAFTATAGPGISLMSELAGLAYFAEIPAVIVDVQRMGPSTGLPTRTCQGDMLSAYYLSHGDCKHVLLIPGNVTESYEFCMESLNLAEHLQTLVFVMTDLDLGMNNWMSDPFEHPKTPIKRGKVLNAEDLAKNGAFARYRDVDGDGIGYRTLPGTNHPAAAYFTRGTGHTDEATYSEKPHDWKDNMDRLSRKFETARGLVPKPVIQTVDGAEIGIIAYGTSDGAVEEARSMLASKEDLKTDYLRLRALPINGEVSEFVANHRMTYVVEQNRDAQVLTIFKSEFPELAAKMESVLHYNGLPIDAHTVVEQILAHEAKENA